MRAFIAVLVLIFSFQSWTMAAEDISEFEIEGMAIGDSILEYFNKKKIDSKAEALYPNKDMKLATFTSSKFENFEEVQFHWLANDSKYIIQSISANISYPNNINECLKQRKIINSEIKSLFSNAEEDDWGKRALKKVDPSGKTFAYQNIYWLNGGNIIVSCRDWSKSKEDDGFEDYLAIMLDSEFFSDWINNKAWK